MGVNIRSCDYLHSKVYWTENGAIIGSANASANGLNFEGSETLNWIEANVFVQGNILEDIEKWFENIWKSSQEITEGILSKAEEQWKKRRNVRPHKIASSILEKLKNNPEFFKDRDIYFAIYRGYMSEEAKNKLKEVREREKVSYLDAYDDWDDLPSDSILIDLYYGRRGAFKFHGFYKTFEENWREKIIRDGEAKYITIAKKLDDCLGMKLNGQNEELLKKKIDKIYEKAIGDDDEGRVIKVYETRNILFNRKPMR